MHTHTHTHTIPTFWQHRLIICGLMDERLLWRRSVSVCTYGCMDVWIWESQCGVECVWRGGCGHGVVVYLYVIDHLNITHHTSHITHTTHSRAAVPILLTCLAQAKVLQDSDEKIKLIAAVAFALSRLAVDESVVWVCCVCGYMGCVCVCV